jgi:hypothetical protein
MQDIEQGMPPAIVFLGTNNCLIPAATAKAFRARMREAGSRSELMLFEGAAHGFFHYGKGDGTAYHDTVKAMDEFLASLGFLEQVGRATLRCVSLYFLSPYRPMNGYRITNLHTLPCSGKRYSRANARSRLASSWVA